MKAPLPTRKEPRISMLGWAWLGLIVVCVTFVTSAWYIAHSNDKSRHITLSLSGQPDHFALRAGGGPRLPTSTPSIPTPPPQTTASTSQSPPLPAIARQVTHTPPADVTAEKPNINIPNAPKPKPPPTSTQDVLEDGSNVLRLEDLPPIGTGSWAKYTIPAPNPLLFTTTKNGPYPRRAPDGRTASRYYTVPYTPRENIPKVALILGGLGLDSDLTARAITELPPQITLAFAPYGTGLPQWVQKARQAGHEVILEIPMEGFRAGADQLGPAGLLGAHTKIEIEERLDWMMTRFSGYFAATNYLGNKFSLTPEKLAIVTDKLTRAGVAYIDDTGKANMVIFRSGVDWINVNQLITPVDLTITPALQTLADQATMQSGALGKSYATPDNIQAIKKWANTLDTSQYQLVPASSLLRTPPR